MIDPAALALAIIAALPAPADEPLDVRVNRSIDRGIDWLFERQEQGGGWRTDDKVHPTGRTALTLLALLHAGVSPSEPRFAKGLDHLIGELRVRRETREGGEAAYRSTYETGITLMLLYDLGPAPRFANEMEPLARFLIDGVDPTTGLWNYPGGNLDLSNSQYAVLGLRACARRGVRPDGFHVALTRALDGVIRCRKADGGFAYMPERYTSGSMTVAGLAMIRFCEEELKGKRGAGKTIKEARKLVDDATAWLERNYDVDRHPEGFARSRASLYYYLFGLERYAAFYDLDRIGDHDWYREGAKSILAKQGKDGSWETNEETCFAILFLRRASLTMPGGPWRSDESGAPDAPDAPDASNHPSEPPPAADVPFLRSWLFAGGFTGTPGVDDPLVVDHVKEKRAKPRAGAKAGKLEWTRYESPDDLVDLKKAAAAAGGTPIVDWCAGYAATRIEAKETTEARLWLDSDDGIRVFLNGELVFEDHHHYGKDGMLVDLDLPPGASTLLVKVENTNYEWTFRARLADRDGAVLRGVAVGP